MNYFFSRTQVLSFLLLSLLNSGLYLVEERGVGRGTVPSSPTNAPFLYEEKLEDVIA